MLAGQPSFNNGLNSVSNDALFPLLTLDEPVLVFQRNSFLRVEEEAKFTEDTIIKRLFEEVCLCGYYVPLVSVLVIFATLT